mmetsp:Transcript_82764/g.210602  ORF Transcript_82764/g.210602 Transcript_82764/m.210602 type:complete len:177 (-) Transcript_82764:186-716(-)|eukprot:CAMPEP_0183429736 /NCGR_PEP_ID=MMETSP0370-20130417/49070_1 /TAXON_ID=268820 /ORGANISM="Peridinium aciculiferum, Strain PAER-2" /LENGTH=176 /DNA_ID=CAMNT_0025614859 /DNA_START=72 /DNA_END=602 /DNA_ORIENTATION=-
MTDIGLTEEQQREFTEKFNDIDKNRTGFVSPFELGVLMRSLGHPLTDEDLRNITAENDRCVTLADFLTIMAKREQDISLQEKLKDGFLVFDRDRSGYINVGTREDRYRSEFYTQMTSLGPNPWDEKEFEEFMSEYLGIEPVASRGGQGNANEDGEVDYMEMIKLMLKAKQEFPDVC